jgi:hypothetical protein
MNSVKTLYKNYLTFVLKSPPSTVKPPQVVSPFQSFRYNFHALSFLLWMLHFPPTFLDLISVIISEEYYTLWSSSVLILLQSPINSSFWGQNIYLSTLFSKLQMSFLPLGETASYTHMNIILLYISTIIIKCRHWAFRIIQECNLIRESSPNLPSVSPFNLVLINISF